MYDHYIALDWAQTNMAIARLTPKSKEPKVIDVKADIGEFIIYLKNLKGKKILTFEETSTSQWLYTELKELVDEIIVCDPRRNRLLLEGPKNDKIDAKKLVTLLRANLLKPVFHSGDYFIYFRKIVSGYEDTVKAYVRAANQRSALFRALGKNHKTDELKDKSEKFVLEGLDALIERLREDRERYEKEFARLCKQYKTISNLKSIPGIGEITAVKLVARIVDISRFKNISHFWSYCGLIKFERLSGGKSYGKRKPRYCRSIKSIICGGAMVSTIEGSNSVLKHRYQYLTEIKRYSDDKAKVATRRLLASIIYGVMKSGKKFDPERINIVTKTT